jgi:hypothetical protein
MRPRSFTGHCSGYSNELGSAMYESIRLIFYIRKRLVLVSRFNALGRLFEMMPVVSELAGSLYIRTVQMSADTIV